MACDIDIHRYSAERFSVKCTSDGNTGELAEDRASIVKVLDELIDAFMTKTARLKRFGRDVITIDVGE